MASKKAPETYAERVSAALVARNTARADADARLAAAMEALHVARAQREMDLAAADAAYMDAVNGPRDEA